MSSNIEKLNMFRRWFMFDGESMTDLVPDNFTTARTCDSINSWKVSICHFSFGHGIFDSNELDMSALSAAEIS